MAELSYTQAPPGGQLIQHVGCDVPRGMARGQLVGAQTVAHSLLVRCGPETRSKCTRQSLSDIHTDSLSDTHTDSLSDTKTVCQIQG